MAVRRKRCKNCKELFTPWNSFAVACSPKCAIALVDKAEGKAYVARIQHKHHVEQKRQLKTRSDRMRAAQKAFNAYIRARDAHLPCVSCGRYHNGQWHAGHFKTAGAHPELRFDEDNCHKQCAPCNNHKSGNISAYRENLVRRIGEQRVEALETYREPKKWTIEELIEIKKTYQKKLKELESARESA